ncbi:hypothetical protein [uncultured Jatrophihabitans sp.]|uniref:hypothetical protein n=1 Tax=uncultured Jatrophihabitans sp. TaxID=1610747 RepID=UPI0035CB00B5
MTIMTDTISVHSGRAAADARHGTPHAMAAPAGPVANPRRLRLGASGAPLSADAAKDAQTAA